MSGSIDQNLNQIYLNQFVAANSCWLYELCIASNNYGYIHMPLVYLTRLRIQHEVYSSAMSKFPTLIGLDNYFQPVIIDGAVVKFPLENFNLFKENSYNLLTNNILIIKKFSKHSIFLKKWLPINCIKAEQEFYHTGKISINRLRRLFDMTAKAISINLANTFIENAFLQLNSALQEDKQFQQKVNELVWSPIFSHISYFNNKLNSLKASVNDNKCSIEDILTFVRDVAFLQNPIGDGSSYETPAYLASIINFKGDFDQFEIKNIYSNNFNPPDIIFDPTNITNNIPNDADYRIIILKFLRLLQVNEEFRHYWGLRVIRLFRLLATDVSYNEDWGLIDYERHLKK